MQFFIFKKNLYFEIEYTVKIFLTLNSLSDDENPCKMSDKLVWGKIIPQNEYT